MIRLSGPPRPTLLALLPLLLLVPLFAACTDDDDPLGPGEGGDATILEGVGSITGVVSNGDGNPASGRDVSAGGIAAETSEDGYFLLSQVPAGEHLLRVGDVDRFTLRHVRVTEGANLHLPDLVVPYYDFETFDAELGATLEVDGGFAGVVIEGGSLVTESGAAYNGTVVSRLTALRPQDGEFYGAYPGLFEGVRGDQSVVPKESFGYLRLVLTSGSNAPLRLAPGATATLRFDVTGSYAGRAPSSLPLWRLDEATGIWHEEGVAVLSGGAYTAVVTSLGGFDFAVPIDPLCSLTGFVVNDSGQPAAGVRVINRGYNHRFAAETVTGADGSYTVDAVPEAVTRVWAASGSIVGDDELVSVGNDCPETVAEELEVAVPAYTMALTWGAEPPDLDAHLLIPMTWDGDWDYYHIAYFSMGRFGDYPFCTLDVDDTSAYGPEIITGTRMYQGRFQYWVHEFEEDDTAALAASGAVVQLTLGGAIYLFAVDDVPTEDAAAGGWWHVFDIDVTAGSITMDPVMRFEPEPSGDGIWEPDVKSAVK